MLSKLAVAEQKKQKISKLIALLVLSVGLFRPRCRATSKPSEAGIAEATPTGAILEETDHAITLLTAFGSQVTIPQEEILKVSILEDDPRLSLRWPMKRGTKVTGELELGAIVADNRPTGLFTP